MSSLPSSPGPSGSPFILYRLCYAMAEARPAAWQRKAFIRGHKAHQIQLFWKVEAVLPVPKGYSHERKPHSAILLPLVFSLCRLREGKFFVKSGLVNMAFASSGVCLFGRFLYRFDNSLFRYCVCSIYCHRLYIMRDYNHILVKE